MVVGEGFEPSKSVTADLQSAPFGRLGKCYFKKKRSTAVKISALLNCCAISY